MDAPSTLPSINPKRSLCVILLLFLSLHIVLIFLIALMGVQYTNNGLVLEIYSVFRTIGIVALYAHVASAVVMYFYSRPSSRGLFFTPSRFINSFTAFLDPFSLMMVLRLPSKLNWIGYLGACVMFGIVVVCFYLDDQPQDKEFSPFDCVVLLLVPMLIFRSSKMYPMLYVSLSIESVYYCITSLMFIYEKQENYATMELVK